MKGSFTHLILLLFLCPYISPAQAITPSIVNVTGGSAISGYYRFDWSVGEMCLIETFVKPELLLENGLLHAGTERPHSLKALDFFATGDIMIFPNPVYTVTEVNLNLPQPGKVSIRLMDVMGKLVMNRQFDYNGAGHIEKVDLQGFPAGTYMLHVLLSPTDQSMSVRKGTYKLVHLTR
jgi:hypothetical protein